jgi:uncharacterized protein
MQRSFGLATLALVALSALGGAAPAGRAPTAPSPARGAQAVPIRVLLLGDSLIATEFGVEFQQILNRTPGYQCKRRAKSATGLARSDAFDWIHAARLAVAKRRPELVVVMIGSNDAQDVVPPAHRRGHPHAFGRVNWEKPGWNAAYRARSAALLNEVASPRREVLWMELPIMRSRRLDKKLQRVRQAQRAVVLARPRDADYLGVVNVMRSMGSPTQTRRQRWRRLRRDGVHFSRRGSQLLARMILPVLHAVAPRVYLHRSQKQPSLPRPVPRAN